MTTIFYFCDESSFHDTHMAVGGLAVNKDAISYISGELDQINTDYKVISEVKWETAKSRRANTHMAYIDLLFRLIQEGRAHAHFRFAPFKEYDHSLSGPKKRAQPADEAYRSTRDARPIDLELIEPLGRYHGYEKDFRGFDRERMVNIVRGFVGGEIIEAPAAIELPDRDSY